MAARLFTSLVQAAEGDRPVIRADFLPVSQLRPSAGELAENHRAALVIAKRDGGWNYALSSKSMDVRPLSRELQNAFQGKGGGTPDMVQGVLGDVSEEDIRSAFATLPS